MKLLIIFSLLLKYKFALFISETEGLLIPLNNTLTPNNNELFGTILLLNHSSSLEVNFVNIPKQLSFIIFQVHSHLYNISLSNLTYKINGTNLGLYSLIVPKIDSFTIDNPNDVDLKVYISVHGYTKKDPIPGGCNMEFNVPISPYIVTQYNKDYVLVDVAPAKSYLDDKCTDVLNAPTIEFYMMYLPNWNFEENTYFDGIQNMLSLDKILENGYVIPQVSQFWNVRRMLSAYPGIGAIYVAVAFSNSSYSVYVPTYSYACSPIGNECELLDGVFNKVILIFLLSSGFVLLVGGHHFFKIEMLLIGMLSGCLITYICARIYLEDLNGIALYFTTALTGLGFGLTWLMLWWLFGIPIYSVLLVILNCGFLISAIIYHSIPGGLPVLEEDAVFWVMFVSVMILFTTAVLGFGHLNHVNMVCCAVLGSYAFFAMESNLKYVVVNAVRRAVVPQFGRAVLAPPFKWDDALWTLSCITVAIFGSWHQLRRNHNKPPFPPPPRSLAPRDRGLGDPDNSSSRYNIRQSASQRIGPTVTERTPLLR